MTLWERVTNIVLRPSAEWHVIESETIAPRALYKNYIAVLALIPAFANLLMILLFGLAEQADVGAASVIFAAVLGYVISLAVVYAVALAADRVAPIFGGVRNFDQALKLTAYALTALWIAAAAMLVPALGAFLPLVGAAYTVYLLFLGAPVMMKIEPKLAMPYVAMVVVIGLAIAFFAGMLHVAVTAGGAVGTSPPVGPPGMPG